MWNRTCVVRSFIQFYHLSEECNGEKNHLHPLITLRIEEKRKMRILDGNIYVMKEKNNTKYYKCKCNIRKSFIIFVFIIIRRRMGRINFT